MDDEVSIQHPEHPQLADISPFARLRPSSPLRSPSSSAICFTDLRMVLREDLELARELRDGVSSDQLDTSEVESFHHSRLPLISALAYCQFDLCTTFAPVRTERVLRFPWRRPRYFNLPFTPP